MLYIYSVSYCVIVICIFNWICSRKPGSSKQKCLWRINELQTITAKNKQTKNKANSSWENNLTNNATNHCAAAVNTSFTLFISWPAACTPYWRRMSCNRSTALQRNSWQRQKDCYQLQQKLTKTLRSWSIFVTLVIS